MNWFPPRSWLSLMCSFQLLSSVAATINITYPVQGVVYPPQGPDTVEWLYTRYGCEFLDIGGASAPGCRLSPMIATIPPISQSTWRHIMVVHSLTIYVALRG